MSVAWKVELLLNGHEGTELLATWPLQHLKCCSAVSSMSHTLPVVYHCLHHNVGLTSSKVAVPLMLCVSRDMWQSCLFELVARPAPFRTGRRVGMTPRASGPVWVTRQGECSRQWVSCIHHGFSTAPHAPSTPLPLRTRLPPPPHTFPSFILTGGEAEHGMDGLRGRSSGDSDDRRGGGGT